MPIAAYAKKDSCLVASLTEVVIRSISPLGCLAYLIWISSLLLTQIEEFLFWTNLSLTSSVSIDVTQ